MLEACEAVHPRGPVRGAKYTTMNDTLIIMVLLKGNCYYQSAGGMEENPRTRMAPSQSAA